MSASIITQLETLSRYNRRANRALYDACSGLLAAELERPRAAVFGSILGTLNHILVVDRMWLDRFTGTEGDPVPLDAVPYPGFRELCAARDEEDTRIEEFIESLSIAFLSTQFQYTDTEGKLRRDPADLLVLHMFNHQTHHRGQVHDLLMQTGGGAPPALDLHRLIRP